MFHRLSVMIHTTIISGTVTTIKIIKVIILCEI